MSLSQPRDRVFSNDAPWAVVCDFDGTAIMEDIADALAHQFLGDQEFRRVNTQFERGDISFRQLLHELFEPIAASEQEIHAFARANANFRPGFLRLLEIARDHEVPFVIASGGLDIYIRPALALAPSHLTERVTLRANHAETRAPEGGGLTLAFPYGEATGSCGTCGSCKGAVVRELQQSGYRVIAIGDGNADRCMAGVAEMLFARARLSAWCDRTEISYTPFETLDIVADFLEAQFPEFTPGERIDDAHTSIA